MMKIKHLILSGIVCLAAVSCDKNNDGPKIYPVAPSTNHTLLIYLGIDNNFQNEKDKIEILRRSWDTAYDANLLVYADGRTNTVLVHIHHDRYGNSVADTVKINEAENSASPEVFGRVLKEAYEGWPAKTNGLVVLSHASGWLKQGRLSNPTRTVINDREGELDLWDFAERIPLKLDYVIFDACFMAGVEVMSELYGKASYVLGSSAEVLAQFVLYDKMMPHLLKGSFNLIPVAEDMYNYAKSQSNPDLWSTTLTVVDIDKFQVLQEFCASVFDGRDIEGETDISKLQQFHPTLDLYTDLGDIMETIARESYEIFTQYLDDCIVYKINTPTYYSNYYNDKGGHVNPIDKFSGLTMYIPQAQYPTLNEEYKVLKWYKAVYE